MFEEIRAKLFEYIEFDEDTETWVWIEGALKITPQLLLGLIADLTFEIEDKFVDDEAFDGHWHTEVPSVARTVRRG